MTEALKARLVGAAVLVGVAMLVLGSLLGGPKERAQPAEGVIVIRPEPERPPSLRERQVPDEKAAPANAEPEPEPEPEPDSRAEPSGSRSAGASAAVSAASSNEQAAGKPTPDSAPVRRAATDHRQPSEQKSPEQKAAEAKRPQPASSAAAAPPRETAEAPATQAAGGDDLYARIAGTSKPTPPVQPAEPAQQGSQAPSQTTTRPAPRAAPAKPTATQGWMVRIASFGDAANAQRMVQRLRDAGYTPSTETVTVANRSYTRVQVGPYASEREARSAQTALKAKVGESGQVIAPR
ncbi:MAG: SPOR domain-containing protein [Abyssibacter sp.]|uniref:SPOR domain-containing protein n=1 Tax=Abyssibacter sp. TaxID=2320200 RepID=UPI00321AA6F0